MEKNKMTNFCHLHCHTQYSLLDGAAKISNLITKAKYLGMNALAITDHGNMYGVPQFVSTAKKEGIKPIIGCEFYIAPNMHNHSDRTRYHQILLAKNNVGYQNLSKLCSLGFLEGYYYKPRIDKQLIKQYSEGLIATTCCLGSEICKTILKDGEDIAEQRFLEWLDIFGSDYYIELQRFGFQDQEVCNEVLLRWANKHNVKVIATNDVHYVEQKDCAAHDILLCIQTGKDYADPTRMRFSSDQFFLKSPQTMALLFQDVPEALENTIEIADKIETLSLDRDVLFPLYNLPAGITDQNEYLKQLSINGAKERFGSISIEVEERINYELSVIKQMGFPGYMLIVQDFVNAAKKFGVCVGPGRGSVAGSLIAFCIGITNIDPLKYNLIFERFLNPERVSMPDIDIDFDDAGRQKVIDYVVNKYGRNQIAQIVTFGSMGAKSAIRDVARVLGLPLNKADYIAKLVPENPGITLAQAFKEVPELAKLSQDLTSLEGKVISFAEILEGSARHTGIHAAGIIIAPNDLINYIPIKSDKDSSLLVTQYEGTVVESVGMLKMDFLGLKTLSIIKDTITLISKSNNITIDIDSIPLDDLKTFELYQRGDTIGTFQFESEGMRQYLIKLHPTNIEDLIAMNALYRPGPIQFIPNFIERKHGRESIVYAHPLLENILRNTYGIMVYQEQIIQTAQIMAGYTPGGADILRKAMGKKNLKEMEKQRQIFVEGCAKKNNLDSQKASEIFDTMYKFAQYGFNRSHSTAYSVLAYQTGYLKANYPSEYMAAVLTHNQGDIDKITLFLTETKRQNITVLGPDINESDIVFRVTKEKTIRFGLGAIKGVGTIAAEEVVKTKRNKIFSDFFDFIERVDTKIVTKKTLEALAMSGAFDSLQQYHRNQYVHSADGELSLIEKALKYSQQIKAEQTLVKQSLFAFDDQFTAYKKIPTVALCEPFDELERLRIEKEMIGFYISGHPLSRYKLELKHFCNCNTRNLMQSKTKDIKLAGILTSVMEKQGKNGKQFARLTVEDYEGNLETGLFGEDFARNKHTLVPNSPVYITGNIIEKYNQKDAFELRVSKVQPLNEIRDKFIKKLKIVLDTKYLTLTTIEQLQSSILKNQGNIVFSIVVVDTSEEKEIQTSFFSKKYKINTSNEFFDSISGISGINYLVQVY